MHIDLSFLQTFAVLAETLSFSRTATILGLSQPSVSRQLKTLEEMLGAPLLIRDTQMSRLTEDGERFRDRVSPMVKDLLAALEHSRSDGGPGKIAGTIRVGALTDAGQSVLFGRLLDFTDQHRAIDLSIHYATEQETVAELGAGNIDFALINKRLSEERFINFEFITEEIVAVTRNVNWRNLANPAEASFISYRNGDPLFEAFMKECFPRHPRRAIRHVVSVNSHRSMIEALMRYDYYAVVPLHSVQSEIDKGLLRIASDFRLSTKLHIVVAKASCSLPRNKALIEHLKLPN